MPVPATNDEFLDLVRKSGVADEVKLTAYLEKLQTSTVPVPPQPAKFAVWLVRDGLITYFQAEQILQGKYKRFTIGKYKVLEKLGAGGMGQVFLCEHKMMRRRVAVKVLPIAKSDDDSARERFYREARAVASLDHPNIVRAYDVDQEDNLHFLVMEFVDGTNLHDLVKKHGVLAVDRACHYLYASAAGLQYSNSMGIIHRDIKPANLLVDRAGIVKILDMGLAMFFKDEDESLTRKFDETVLGTADYLAPEQAIDSHTVDIRADLYSLGGTFYYLLTGSVPFPDGSIAQKLLMHQTRDPKPIGLIRPEVPDGVVAIVDKLMKKDPKERYQSPAELMEDLAAFVQTPIAPPSAAEMPRLSRAALGGATQMSSIGRAQASGVLLAQSSVSSIQVPVRSGGLSAQTSAVIDAPRGVPAAIWEDIASSTTSQATADTSPEKSKEKLKPKPEEAPQPMRKKLLIGGLAAAFVIALGVIGAVAFGGKDKTTASQADAGAEATGPRKLFVTKGSGPAGEATFATLAAAIAKVKPDDTIVLMDDPHEELPVVISATSAGRFKGVVIESKNPASPILFKLPERGVQVSDRGLLELTGTDGLCIRHVRFHAGDRAGYGVRVRGAVEGLCIEHCTLLGARTAAILLEKTAAIPDRPVRLHKLLIRPDGASRDGIQLVGAANAIVSHVRITDCRFAGAGWNALHTHGPVADVEFRNNRIFNFEYGIQMQGPDNNCQLRILSNTFHTVFGAVVYSAAKPTSPSEVLLQNNYIAKSAAILKGPENRVPGLKSLENVRDKETKPGVQGLDAKASELANYALPRPNVEEDNQFLKIDDGSPLKAYGPAKLRIGAQ